LWSNPPRILPWIFKKLPTVRIGGDIAEAIERIVEYIKHGFELTPVHA